MACRKCGESKITRRRAGEFFCQRCGMQPGALQMDRSGAPKFLIEADEREAAAAQNEV